MAFMRNAQQSHAREYGKMKSATWVPPIGSKAGSHVKEEVIILDERGRDIDSLGLADLLAEASSASSGHFVCGNALDP